MKLNECNVIITGASSGIGYELVRLLLDRGCRVVACARQVERIDYESDNLYPFRCDVSVKEEVDALFAFAEEKLGTVDLFIANAGFAYYEKIQEADWNHNRAIFDTNVLSPIYAAEKMKEVCGSRPYNFVVTASAMGLLSLPGYALYSGTKAALRGFADAYRYELGKNQHFQVVYPVATRTRFFDRAGGETTPVPWPTQTPEEVAERIIAGIERDQKHIHPSKLFYATSLANRFLPFILPAYAAYYQLVFKNWLRKNRRKAGRKERKGRRREEERTMDREGSRNAASDIDPLKETSVSAQTPSATLQTAPDPALDPTVTRYPAPWKLQGSGYIMLFKFSRKFVREQGRVPEFLKGRFAGGFGSVMVVDYKESNAGPYGELLFMPGKFLYHGKRLDTISKIYVSSKESVVNGRLNWGIPKEEAAFDFSQISENEERIRVMVGDRVAADFILHTGKLHFPVSTKLLPFPLVQRYQGRDLYTDFSGSGTGSFASIRELRIDPQLFPDISECRPIAVIKVDPFRITFPLARK